MPRWRHAMFWTVLAAPIGALLFLAPIVQPHDYHAFADRRSFWGIPHTLDVVSNLALAIAGLWGLGRARKRGGKAAPWLVVFTGVTLTFFGSCWYHLAPNDDRLVFDRLPMTLALAGLFVAVVSEYVEARVRAFLWPAVVIGGASVLHWRLTGDVGPYAYVQLAPLLGTALALVLFEMPTKERRLWAAALVLYGLAKVFELFDARIFAAFGELLSGHTLKHLFAAAAIGALVALPTKGDR